jgi:uracil phosphoribosyltransferase
MLRDVNTERADFIFYSNRIMRLLVEEGLNHLPVVTETVTSPVGKDYTGVKFEGKICGVSIMRAGESMEQALRECCRSVRIGKILIQRNEETSKPKLFYDKLPTDIANRWVLLLDPMLATGGSAIMAVEVLKSKGVPEDRILFLNLIASPEGVKNFADKVPKVRVVTAFVDQGLDDKKYVLVLFIGNMLTLISQLYCTRSWRLWRSLLHSLMVASKSSYRRKMQLSSCVAPSNSSSISLTSLIKAYECWVRLRAVRSLPRTARTSKNKVRFGNAEVADIRPEIS